MPILLGHWHWGRAAVPAQSWAQGVQEQLSLFPVLKVTVLAAVTGVWMEQSLSQWDAGFLSQCSALLVAQTYTQIFTSLRLRCVNKATKI